MALINQVLDQKRIDVLHQLSLTKKWGWYLAGGTALALQLYHRTSVDFDFYVAKEFYPKNFLPNLIRVFSQGLKIVTKEKNTLIFNITNQQVSTFKLLLLPIPLVDAPKDYSGRVCGFSPRYCSHETNRHLPAWSVSGFC